MSNYFCSAGLPSFIVYPVPQDVVNGSSISLDCLVRGEPTPTVSWLKDFMPLNIMSNSSIEIFDNGTLFVSDADLDDAGFYTCIADNGLGINQVSVNVDVFPLIIHNKTGLSVQELVTK